MVLHNVVVMLGKSEWSFRSLFTWDFSHRFVLFLAFSGFVGFIGIHVRLVGDP